MWYVTQDYLKLSNESIKKVLRNIQTFVIKLQSNLVNMDTEQGCALNPLSPNTTLTKIKFLQTISKHYQEISYEN